MGIHGGDIYRNHIAIDFSINVNPLGVPKAVKTEPQNKEASFSSHPQFEAY